MPRSSGFAAQTYRVDAVVLRTHKLGEADRIVTLLSNSQGLIRAVAKGVRRTTSKFGARLEPFMVNDLQLIPGRSLHVVTQAVSRSSHGQAIAAHYGKYTVATAMAETAERLTDTDAESAGAQYRLLIGALGSLARGEHAPELILDSYLLRALATAGWAPSFTDCARCGEPGPHQSFSAPLGGAVCVNCRPPGASSPALATMELLAALLSGDWGTADGSEPTNRREAAGLVAHFVQWHLERSVRSLSLVERP
ncbi:DNA repair protein RecO [Psychromicrobium xiongbiense]|uniref:DNA repair protein RecO n=1 Tax=Psychromicrobium xiongbiense TaxID=3051184 RepID=UPI002554648D|nr:DNA repair protein RecO [Psychromicrobium sp. YIM S02556]